MYNAREFLANIAEKINSGFNNIYIDFSEIIYLDSSGVGAIIKIIQLSKEKKVNIKFRGITGMPRKVLKMSNILTIISEDI
jgi:anti-anti-sigma factor